MIKIKNLFPVEQKEFKTFDYHSGEAGNRSYTKAKIIDMIFLLRGIKMKINKIINNPRRLLGLFIKFDLFLCLCYLIAQMAIRPTESSARGSVCFYGFFFQKLTNLSCINSN